MSPTVTKHKVQSEQPITEARIRRALVTVAHIISTYGETEYLSLMERLERELERHREGRDPVSRARAILKAHAVIEHADQ
jgi:hypothetical protein